MTASQAGSPMLTLMTAPTPGAVAMIQLQGAGLPELLTRLTGKASLPIGKAVLADFAGIDHGLLLRWREDWAQLMPHGGPRVVHQLIEHCLSLGASIRDAADLPARLLYPEASSELEADMLAVIATAASPAAVDRLLGQPRLWWEALASHALDDPQAAQDVLERSDALQRLLAWPSIALVGRPNVGKSTLTNAMLGRGASIVADMPGTTRDWVAGTTQIQGLAVRWLDTPGIRHSDDPIEQQAIEMSRQVIERADVVIAMRDPSIDWPDLAIGDRPPDVWVMNKADQQPDSPAKGTPRTGRSAEQPLPISAKDGAGLVELGQAVLRHLKLDGMLAGRPQPPALWAFNATLRTIVRQGDWASLRAYVTPSAVPSVDPIKDP